MKRRDFLKFTIGSSILSILPSCKKTDKYLKKGEKPNILFICVDDLRPELGCYGKNYIHSPNIDQLASSGCTFTNHYTTAPSCGPSRESLLTGLCPKTQQHLHNYHMQDVNSQRKEQSTPESFVHNFKRNGYYTVGIGKISHSPNGKIDKKPFYEMPYSWDEMLVAESKWKGRAAQVLAYADGRDRFKLKFKTKPYECADVDDEGYPDGLNAQLALKKIDELNQKDQAFFLAVGFFKPHLPFNSPKKYWDLYSRDKIEISPIPDKPKDTSDKFLHKSWELFDRYLESDEMGGIGIRISDKYAKKLRHAYFAAVSYIDAQVGKVLNKLKETDLLKNTIIVLWGDHGWHLGDHTIWGKHSLFNISLNSPLIISCPGKQKDIKSRSLISTVDIYPTLCELAGIPAPKNLDGISFTKALDNPEYQTRKSVLSYWHNSISIKNQDYRLLTYSFKNDVEYALFDHKEDIIESRNIAKNNSKIVSSLLKEISETNKGFSLTGK